jgi:hypothetical protein
MKKTFTIIAMLFLLAGNFLAGDRMVIIERYTSWTCPPCATNNPIMEAYLQASDPDRIVGIAYHMNWPAPGNDGYYLRNPTDNNSRRSMYGINSIPQARMDGIITVNAPYSIAGLTAFFNSRTNILSPITVILEQTEIGDSIRLKATIYTEILMPSATALLHFSLQEKHNTFTSPPGTNGETDFYDVMAKMNNNGTGHSLTLLPGQTVVVERTFYKDPSWNLPELMPIMFIQQGVEMLNAGRLPANFTLIPISSYKSVLHGQSQNATYQLSIPVVAQGYNSAVTLTAEVDPPNAGITVSFPNGNVVSTFPSTFDMTVNSNASVPVGAYRIIVTGTNTNNKTHKTSVAYLVGQNYINVTSNRLNLQFSVDNTTYTGVRLFAWDINSQHTLSAISPQTFGSTRYVFQSWSNSGDSSHTITVNPNTTNYTVNYKTQFRLLSSVTPGGLPVTVTGGNQFYDSASSVTFSATPSQLTHNGKEYYFQRWNGSGNGSYSGTEPTYTINSFNNVVVQAAVYDTIAPIGITNLNTGVPQKFSLHQNYPNPFNPVTKIKFDLPKASNVSIKLYDVIGNEVAQIYSGDLQAGYFEADFNASSYASGVYFYRITAGDFTSVKRMVLVK